MGAAVNYTTASVAIDSQVRTTSIRFSVGYNMVNLLWRLID